MQIFLVAVHALAQYLVGAACCEMLKAAACVVVRTRMARYSK